MDKYELEQYLNSLEELVIQEFKFSKEFKFRADYCIPEYGILIEFEGISNSAISRHTSLIGYSKDCIKYNLATILDYKVLRYTKIHEIAQIRKDLVVLMAHIKATNNLTKCKDCLRHSYYKTCIYCQNKRKFKLNAENIRLEILKNSNIIQKNLIRCDKNTFYRWFSDLVQNIILKDLKQNNPEYYLYQIDFSIKDVLLEYFNTNNNELKSFQVNYTSKNYLNTIINFIKLRMNND